MSTFRPLMESILARFEADIGTARGLAQMNDPTRYASALGFLEGTTRAVLGELRFALDHAYRREIAEASHLEQATRALLQVEAVRKAAPVEVAELDAILGVDRG